jgi:hypothetical protein
METWLRDVEHARFARATAPPAERADRIAQALRLLDAIEEDLHHQRKKRRPAIASALLLLACAASLSAVAIPPQSAMQTVDIAADFARGVEAYLKQDYVNAAQAFERHVQQHPRDANAWHDLGNAYRRSGRRGEAVWAWRQAVRIAPRFDDPRHNISITASGGVPTQSALSFTSEEAILFSAVIWWAAAGSVILRRWHRRPLRLPVFVGAVLLALAVLGMVLPRWIGAPTAIAITDPTPLHTTPAFRSAEIARFESGTAFRVITQRGEWLHVRAGSRNGWVESARIKLVPP